MPGPSPDHSAKTGFRLSLGMIFLPGIIFYGLLCDRLVNLPYLDDYDNVLGFMNALSARHTLWSRIAYVLTAQHNEYKLFFENTIFAVEYALTGHANFIVLCILGDLSIFFLAIVLWKMFLPKLDTERRAALFIPVSWLLFQLSYAETTNWAAPGIQNLYIPVFSLATFLSLARDDRRSFLRALGFVVLAIATSGNGFIAAVVGMLMLLRAKRFRDLVPWAAVTGAMALLYAYHYNFMSSQSPKEHSVLASLLHVNLLYIFSFLGSLAAIKYVLTIGLVIGSLLLGVALVLFFAYHAASGGNSRNPAVAAAILFVVLTAVGVAGLRSDFGVAQSVAGRYRIYSTLALILVWFVLAEKHLEMTSRPLRRSRLYLSAVAFSIVLGLVLDAIGYGYLVEREAALVHGMSLYEHPPWTGTAQGPTFPYRFVNPPVEFNLRARSLLLESADLGIYKPPDLPLPR